MDIQIRQSKPSDITEYTSLLQQTYEHAYVKEEIGLTKDQFSKDIFENQDTQNYLRGNLINNDEQKSYVVTINNQLIGSITVKKNKDDFEIKGFYVHPKYQGRGIGKDLWNKALEFIGDHDIIIDLYAHNTRTLKMYEKWGFEVDTTRGEKGYFYRHWPEWPQGLQAKCVYMRKRAS